MPMIIPVTGRLMCHKKVVVRARCYASLKRLAPMHSVMRRATAASIVANFWAASEDSSTPSPRNRAGPAVRALIDRLVASLDSAATRMAENFLVDKRGLCSLYIGSRPGLLLHHL
mmetsp:Transcript_41730/g.82569  ORF Transcript_41730/g.82569 Transcript_41730/m.82569 type:complete len:115 (-) Transcript_41730:156-500(-)